MPDAAASPDQPRSKPSVWQAFVQPAAWTMFFFLSLIHISEPTRPY